MELFVRVKVPEYCYIHEAAHWIAFKVIPDSWPAELGKDADDYISDHLDHMQSLSIPTYSSVIPIITEIVQGVDPHAFARHYELSGGQSPKEIQDEINRLKELERKYPPHAAERGRAAYGASYEERFSEFNEQLESALYLEETLFALDHLSEVARAKLFSAPIAGKVSCRGILVVTKDDDTEQSIEGLHQIVPKEVFRMSEINWKDASLGSDSSESANWVGLQVSFRELLSEFPILETPRELVKLKDFGTCLIRDSDKISKDFEASQDTPPQRATKTENAIRRAVKNEFGRRLTGRVAYPNRESLVQDCIHWVTITFEETISRSTAQRYLSPLDAQITAALAQDKP